MICVTSLVLRVLSPAVSHGVVPLLYICLFVSLTSTPYTLVSSITVVIAEDVDDNLLSVLAIWASPGGVWQVSEIVYVGMQ